MIQDIVKRVSFRLKLYSDPPVIQCSPPRTGSTLLWNVLRVGYPQKKVIKTHGLKDLPAPMIRMSRIIMSVRNPLDTVSSSILRYRKEPSREFVSKQIKEIDERGIWDTLEFKGRANVLILKYEDFSGDFDYTFGQLEQFMRTPIPEDRQKVIKRDFSIESVEQKSASLGSFGTYDAEDQVHGCHVSRYRGASNYYQDFLGDEEIRLIYFHYRPIFDAFGYDSPL